MFYLVDAHLFAYSTLSSSVFLTKTWVCAVGGTSCGAQGHLSHHQLAEHEPDCGGNRPHRGMRCRFLRPAWLVSDRITLYASFCYGRQGIRVSRFHAATVSTTSTFLHSMPITICREPLSGLVHSVVTAACIRAHLQEPSVYSVPHLPVLHLADHTADEVCGALDTARPRARVLVRRRRFVAARVHQPLGHVRQLVQHLRVRAARRLPRQQHMRPWM